MVSSSLATVEYPMAVYCEFIDLIIPIKKIDRVYPGGFAAYLTKQKDWLGKSHWYDTYLYRRGAMEEPVIEKYINEWHALGLVCEAEINGTRIWKELCVVQCFDEGPTYPCDWISYDPITRSAFMKGTEPGRIAGLVHKGYQAFAM